MGAGRVVDYYEHAGPGERMSEAEGLEDRVRLIHADYTAIPLVLGSVDGSVRFFGLTPTSMKLEGLDRHQRLIDSYKKLHTARATVAAQAAS